MALVYVLAFGMLQDTFQGPCRAGLLQSARQIQSTCYIVVGVLAPPLCRLGAAPENEVEHKTLRHAVGVQYCVKHTSESSCRIHGKGYSEMAALKGKPVFSFCEKKRAHFG